MAAPDTVENILADGYNYECKWNNTTPLCYFCDRKLTVQCYAFVQSREHYDRDIMFLACSDQCPVAMKTKGISLSNCIYCQRDYIHMRYDNDICVNCTNTTE